MGNENAVEVDDMGFYGTISVIKQMYDGKILTLPTGERIGMGEDLSIGFIMKNSKGKEGIAPLATLTLKDLHIIMTKHNIIPIPKAR